MQRIAVLGTGAMGSRLVQNLLKAQYPVVVYNRTESKIAPLVAQGAAAAKTPRAAAQQADIVISMVRDDDASRRVWLDPDSGAVGGLGQGSIAIESSTLTLDWTQALAAALSARGAAFLDAPVVGSRPQAEAGQLIYLAGGDAETVQRVQPVLTAAGASAVYPVGPTGQGMAMKLAVNALFGLQVAALAELIGLLSKAGIAPEKAMACLGELPVISPAARGAGSLMALGQHLPLFPIELVEKDFGYVVQSAQALGALTPVAAAAREVYREAIAQGQGGDNITGIVKRFTELRAAER